MAILRKKNHYVYVTGFPVYPLFITLIVPVLDFRPIRKKLSNKLKLKPIPSRLEIVRHSPCKWAIRDRKMSA